MCRSFGEFLAIQGVASVFESAGSAQAVEEDADGFVFVESGDSRRADPFPIPTADADTLESVGEGLDLGDLEFVIFTSAASADPR